MPKSTFTPSIRDVRGILVYFIQFYPHTDTLCTYILSKHISVHVHIFCPAPCNCNMKKKPLFLLKVNISIYPLGRASNAPSQKWYDTNIRVWILASSEYNIVLYANLIWIFLFFIMHIENYEDWVATSSNALGILRFVIRYKNTLPWAFTEIIRQREICPRC